MNEQKTLKYFSTFSGIGGFELGIERAVHRSHKQGGQPSQKTDGGGIAKRGECELSSCCVGYSEIDKYASSIYARHFPDHKNYGDITAIVAEDLPDFDLFVGGFPCQAFSIAGRRRGFADTRGTLFFDIARILRAKRPRLFLLENVKGLLSHDDGKTFATIVATLDELRYDLQWQVLNSKDFGVPQNRERIFIVGNTRESTRPEVFPLGESVGGDPAGTLESSYHKGGHTGTYPLSPVAYTLKARNDSGIDAKHPQTLIGTLRTHKDGKGFREIKEGISPTIPARAREDGSGQPVVIDLKASPNSTRRGVVSEHGYAKTLDHNCAQGIAVNQREEVRRGDVAYTVTASQSAKQFSGVEVEQAIRRLTPVECERLQGFPDNWTVGISDTQRYKCLGNAVTVNVIAAIVDKMIDTSR